MRPGYTELRDSGEWAVLPEHRLEPLNPGYEPIFLSPESEGEVRVIAELVEVLR